MIIEWCALTGLVIVAVTAVGTGIYRNRRTNKFRKTCKYGDACQFMHRGKWYKGTIINNDWSNRNRFGEDLIIMVYNVAIGEHSKFLSEIYPA